MRQCLALLALCVGVCLAHAGDVPTLPTRDLVQAAKIVASSRPGGGSWKTVRFLSFSNLDPAQREQDKRTTRMALATVQPSSWPLGDCVAELTPELWAVDIVRMGWPKGAWEAMSENWPYYASMPAMLTERFEATMGTRFPLMRADVFVEDCWNSRWYAKFLNLPKTRDDFFALHGLHQSGAEAFGVVANNLTVLQHPGKVARYKDGEGRSIWLRMNYSDRRGRNDSVKHPTNFDCHYNECSFELPNGLDAYISFEGDTGHLSRFADTKIAQTRSGRAVELGRSCFECHRSGTKTLDHAEPLTSLGEIAAGLMRKRFDRNTLTALVVKDRERWARALKAVTGDTPVAWSRGLDSLQERYRKDLTISDVAQELGVDVAVLRQRAASVKGLWGDRETSRERFEELFPELRALFQEEDARHIRGALR